MVQFQHGDKIRIQCRALTTVVIYNPFPQGRVEMVMAQGSVDLHEANAVHHFRVRYAIDHGGVDSTVGEARPQAAIEGVEVALYFLYIGLEPTVLEDQFTAQARGSDGIQRTAFEERAVVNEGRSLIVTTKPRRSSALREILNLK